MAERGGDVMVLSFCFRFRAISLCLDRTLLPACSFAAHSASIWPVTYSESKQVGSLTLKSKSVTYSESKCVFVAVPASAVC
jgi:hypothetical protein